MTHPDSFNVTKSLILAVSQASSTSALFKHRARDGWHFPKCELIVYLQQFPQPAETSAQQPLPAAELSIYEHELQHPTGRLTPALPPIQFSMVAFSPDCGYAITSQGPPLQSPREHRHLFGLPFEVMQQRARRHVFGFAVVIGLQLWLLLRQLRDSHSPAVLNRISFTTAGILVMGDGLSTLLLTGSSVMYPGLFVLLMAAICLGFQRMLFGTQLMMEIWAVQGPELEARSRAHGLTATPQRPAAVPRSLDTGILPVAVPSGPATDEFGEPIVETHACLTTGAFPIMICFVVAAPLAVNLPWYTRRIYFCALALFSLSFWIPQIKRNAIRNCRLPFRWEFVIGQTILRLLPLAYVYSFHGNVFL